MTTNYTNHCECQMERSFQHKTCVCCILFLIFESQFIWLSSEISMKTIDIAPEDKKTMKTDSDNHQNDSEDDGTGLAQRSDSDDEMDLKSFAKPSKQKKRKKGIIYVSNIPKHMNVIKIREILGQYGKVGRVYLQPEKQQGRAAADKKKKNRKRYNIHFTEGWIEFESKRVAKQIVPLLNNKQISSRKKSKFFDSLWSMKYLPRFKWVHLTERMNYEQAVHKQRLQTEVSQARRETTFFQNNLDKSEFLRKKSKKEKLKVHKEPCIV